MTDQDRETNAIERLENNGYDVTRDETGSSYTVVQRAHSSEPLTFQAIDLDDLEMLARVLRLG